MFLLLSCHATIDQAILKRSGKNLLPKYPKLFRYKTDQGAKECYLF